jgi:phosphoglucosamine mutase
MEKVREAIDQAEKRMEGRGRVLVRYSGTEPLIRIMVEADNEKLIEEIVELIEEAIRKEGIVEG